jgi:hypothetical protein
MALTGVHVVFGYVTATVGDRSVGPSLPFNATASATMTSAGTASVAAADNKPGQRPVLSISASAPIFYATGPNPDPANGPRRYFDPSASVGGREDIFVNGGDKVAWQFA